MLLPKEGVISAIFDSTPVYMDTMAKTKLTKGDVFQQVLLPTFCFSEQLVNFQYLLTQTKLENVASLVQSILAFIKDNKELRKRLFVLCSQTEFTNLLLK